MPVVSAIPAVASGPVIRSVTVKRLARLRWNWFMVGSIFGVGISFFMNFLISAIIIPEYRQRAAGQDIVIAEFEQDTIADLEPLAKHDMTTSLASAYPLTLALEVGKGDTLVGMLLKHQVPEEEAHNVVAALKAKFNPRQLKVGQRISVTLERHEKLGDRAAVKELAIRLPNLSTVELQRLQDGNFNVAAVKAELFASAYRANGTVKTSFSQALDDAGVPLSAINELIKAFSYDVDFQRDIHPGDTIEVLFDRKVTKTGEVGGHENLRYAALTMNGKKTEIFRFRDSDGDYAWFDTKGHSVKKSLIRTPIDGARITSRFGMRTHPILGYSKMHRGVDFGAPTGTPIYAAGDGTVTFRGWKNGYGNFVEIRHNGTYSTAYGHISRFGKVSVGSRVKQGQVIAYVGSTGMSTGPHLHYEVRENGRQVNPVSKQFNMASGLSGQQLAAFKSHKRDILRELASLSGQHQFASR